MSVALTRKLILVLFLLMLLPIEGVFASATPTADPINEIVQQQVSHLQLERVEQYWTQLQKEYKGYLPDIKSEGFVQ
ncbi:stage III sporulation protein AE, partial [Peribacillus sp. SIMBA_075]